MGVMSSVKNKKTAGNSLNIYLRPATARLLSLRLMPRNASAAIDAAISRYLTICARHRPELTAEEWAAVQKSIRVDSSGLCIETVPWSAVEDAHQSGLLADLEVDAYRLVDKLKGLSPRRRDSPAKVKC